MVKFEKNLQEIETQQTEFSELLSLKEEDKSQFVTDEILQTNLSKIEWSLDEFKDQNKTLINQVKSFDRSSAKNLEYQDLR